MDKRPRWSRFLCFISNITDTKSGGVSKDSALVCCRCDLQLTCTEVFMWLFNSSSLQLCVNRRCNLYFHKCSPSSDVSEGVCAILDIYLLFASPASTRQLFQLQPPHVELQMFVELPGKTLNTLEIIANRLRPHPVLSARLIFNACRLQSCCFSQ